MSGWSPKRNLRIANLVLPSGTEVAIDNTTLQLAGVPDNAKIKSIELQCRGAEVIRFATTLSGTITGPYRSIKNGQTIYEEDMAMALSQFETAPWRVNNASGTGDAVLEIVYSDG